MSLKPVKYIQVDDKKGILYSADKESLLVPVAFIKTLDSIFVQLVGRKGADILIYKTGEALGREYVSTLEVILKKEKTVLSPETRIQINCNAICMEAGWGRGKILKIDLDKDLFEVKISYAPSRRFFKRSGYNLERGLIAGVYQQITRKEIYCYLVKENKEQKSAVFAIKKEIPEGIRAEEKLILLTRRKLEQKIKESQKELKERIEELQKFYKLTVGRELRMVELKKEVKRLREELRKEKKQK